MILGEMRSCAGAVSLFRRLRGAPWQMRRSREIALTVLQYGIIKIAAFPGHNCRLNKRQSNNTQPGNDRAINRRQYCAWKALGE